jgi:predicted TIM-barrel fold metal-dependent hydrolase
MTGLGDIAAIDMHAHFVPAAYRRALAKAGIDRPDGFPYVPGWSVEGAVASMDALGVESALISVSSPGVDLGPGTDPVRLAREVNDEGAEVIRSRPRRLGLLASLPLPDVDAALQEIRHAVDDLDVDGFVLMTNYRGIYLGDPRFDEVMDELERRDALVALHPTSPPAADAVALGQPRPMLEFPFETTRAVVNMILNGTLRRRRRIRVLVPHVGAALPVLADRVQALTAAFADGDAIDVHAELRGMWFDVAGEPLPNALAALLRLVGPERIVYGSDVPFAPLPLVRRSTERLLETELLGDAERQALMRANALALTRRRGSERAALEARTRPWPARRASPSQPAP